jgi:serine/threonine-protein kinase
MNREAEAVHPGVILAGRYQIARVLGRGAMGVVVEATDLQSGEPRAVKLLTPAALQHATAVDRFFREAHATARLTSEHAVRVLDIGTLTSGAPYMAMELLVGADLRASLKRRGALPTHEAAHHVMQACRALHEAHLAGIVHRDLKPANLFLTRRADGSACIKVLDFGISKAMFQGEGDDELTVTNAVLGSPAYMSPEQIRSARSVDPRTDIWSLGVVLYQLVTGKLPFASPSASDLVNMVVRDAPALPSKLRPGLPLALDGVILRCLEKDPALRYADIAELGAALEPFVPSSRGGASVPERAERQRRAGLVALSVAGALLLAFGLTIAVALAVFR